MVEKIKDDIYMVTCENEYNIEYHVVLWDDDGYKIAYGMSASK